MTGFYMTGVCAEAEETAFGAFGNSLVKFVRVAQLDFR
jgi:hypothetical protein